MTFPTVTNESKLTCGNCGEVMTVSCMGQHLGPCYKGKTKERVLKQRAASARYGKTLQGHLSRARTRLNKLLVEVPTEAVKKLGEHPSYLIFFLHVDTKSPFY